MKKMIALCLLICMMATGCGRVMDRYETGKTYRVCASCYPIYALSLMVTKDVPGIALSSLIQPQDGCLRAYSLSEWDVARAASCDMLILGGRGLESYESALLAWEDGPILLCAMQGLTLKNNGQTAVDEESGHFEGENPWLFLSPEGAEEIVRSIAANMEIADPAWAGLYAMNAEEAQARLEELAREMKNAGAAGKKVALLHEGLCYLADFLEMETVYIYQRESGSAVSDNMLTRLLEEMEASGAECVAVETQAPDALIRALEDAGYAVCRVDTLSGHGDDGNADAYCEIMLENAKRLAGK